MLLTELPNAKSHIYNGLTIKVGYFTFRVTIKNRKAAQDFIQNYSEFPVLDDNDFYDFDVVIKPPSLLRKFLYPQVNFYCNEVPPFLPLPKEQAYAMLEWGMNWCIANYAHNFLIIHAAVIEKNNYSIILPGLPGAGKSTLTAALTTRGWRLLSDELTLISLDDGSITPLSRPINLKNNSIDIIKAYSPSSQFSKVAHDTHKGSVALMKPPKLSVNKVSDVVKPRFIIFPKYEKNSTLMMKNVHKKDCFIEMIKHSFNYNILGHEGFNTLTNLTQTIDCFSFVYSELDQAIEKFDSLVNIQC